ncbi:hypothetical protein EJB05_36592 [Eragrostis curvula]|uniref:Uncharacterized protein n=1 Tax=Eragrostis curvula TaxID=38414 RepID=A0A5J9U9S0_9POAL|nr:hypothetical protein EJB05_36592 [Eragrostis curvula]
MARVEVSGPAPQQRAEEARYNHPALPLPRHGYGCAAGRIAAAETHHSHPSQENMDIAESFAFFVLVAKALASDKPIIAKTKARSAPLFKEKLNFLDANGAIILLLRHTFEDMFYLINPLKYGFTGGASKSRDHLPEDDHHDGL